jgi:hypothetical protein
MRNNGVGFRLIQIGSNVTVQKCHVSWQTSDFRKSLQSFCHAALSGVFSTMDALAWLATSSYTQNKPRDPWKHALLKSKIYLTITHDIRWSKKVLSCLEKQVKGVAYYRDNSKGKTRFNDICDHICFEFGMTLDPQHVISDSEYFDWGSFRIS